jgi:hypothetical protein
MLKETMKGHKISAGIFLIKSASVLFSSFLYSISLMLQTFSLKDSRSLMSWGA